jgi:hypothetical protein
MVRYPLQCCLKNGVFMRNLQGVAGRIIRNQGCPMQKCPIS